MRLELNRACKLLLEDRLAQSDALEQRARDLDAQAARLLGDAAAAVAEAHGTTLGKGWQIDTDEKRRIVAIIWPDPPAPVAASAPPPAVVEPPVLAPPPQEA